MSPTGTAIHTPELGNSHVRYRVLVFAVLLAGLTYLDRVCISLTAPLMMKDLGLSQIQMSFVFSAFTLAFGIFDIPSGWWGDKVGTRRVLTRIVLWWSTFTILTGAVFNYLWLLITRFCFGAGEAGSWPNVSRTFSRWFPTSERGTTQGIFFMGAHLAGGFTPLLVTAMLNIVSWRTLFAVFGSIGFIWAGFWYRWFRDEPRMHASIRQDELRYIEEGTARQAENHFAGTPWKRLLANRTVLALCLMYFTQVYGFNFYVTWLPTYLKTARGFTSFKLGILAGLPFILSLLADVLGGLTTDRLTKRYGLRVGRATVGGGALAAAGILLLSGASVPGPVAAAVLISLAGAASNFMLGAAWGTCIDLGGRHSGVMSATMNTSGQVGGVLSPVIAAFVAQRFTSWSMPLYLTGTLYLFGALCWLWIDPERKNQVLYPSPIPT
jgi:MFS transporter, ACS family, glucarate transporter